MSFNILGVDPPYYTRAETNTLLSTKADSVPTNSSFTVIINNTTSSLSYLYNQISQVTPLINQEVQLDSSIYTNVNCTDGVQFLKQNSNGSRDILGILSDYGYYVVPPMIVNSLSCGSTLYVNNNNQLIINSNITGTNNIQKTLNITGNDTSSYKLIDTSNNVRSITGGTNINLNISNNTIFLNGNNTISGITNLVSTVTALQPKLNITGNDTSSFKLIDTSNNVRSITGGTNINLNVSNNTIFLSGNNSISGITNLTSTLSSLQPALISDNTFGANPLLNGNTIKSISVGGNNIFMSFPNPNSIQLYTNNIQSTLTANGNDSTSYKMLDTGTNTIRSITGGTNINLNVSNNTVFINGNNSISGITNLVSTVTALQPTLTNIGDDIVSYKILDNRNNVRSITGGTNINLNVSNNTIFINGNNSISGITNLTSTLSSLQPTLNIIGNDTSSFKLIDSSNNVRSITGGTNITMTNNSNNLIINGPSFYGNDAASGYSLIYNNVVKSLKPYGCITFSSNNNSITINGPIFNGDNTPANGINLLYQGYVRSIVASDGIILAYSPTSVLIGADFNYLYSKSDVDTIASGLSTAIGSCYTKYQSDNKYATVTTVSNISGYTFSNEFTLTTTTSGGKTTTNVAMNFINMLVVDGLLSALAGKNDLLTIRGNDTDSGGYKLINSSIARSLKPGLNITLTQNSNDITIAGPDLSNYVTTGGLATALGTSYIPNTNDTSYVKAYYNQLSNGNNVVKIGLITFGNNSKIQSYTLQFDIEAIVNAGENCQCNTVFLNLSAPILDTYTYNVFYAAVSRTDLNTNIPVDFVICQESSSYRTVTYGIYADFDCDTVNYTVKAPPQSYVNLNNDLGSPYNFPTPNKTLNYNPVAMQYSAPVFSSSLTVNGSGSIPLIKLTPNLNDNESSLAFYRKTSQSLVSAGDAWFIGQNISGIGAGNFGISTSGIGTCFSINSSGVSNFNYSPTVPTPSTSDNTTKIASTAYVQNNFANYNTKTAADARFLPWVGGRVGQAGTALTTITSQATYSSTRTTTGTYLLTFSSPHPAGVNYCAVASALNTTNCVTVNWDNTASTQVSFFVRDNTNTYTNLAFNFVVFGS